MTLKYQAVYNSPLLEGCPQDGVFIRPGRTGLFLLAPKETKVSAENFCIEVSAWAWAVDSQKFVRPI